MIVGTKVKILKVRTSYLQQWVGHEAEVTGVDGEKVYVVTGEGVEKKHLTLKPEWFEILSVRIDFRFLALKVNCAIHTGKT